jgi:hypothetical protein
MQRSLFRNIFVQEKFHAIKFYYSNYNKKQNYRNEKNKDFKFYLEDFKFSFIDGCISMFAMVFLAFEDIEINDHY